MSLEKDNITLMKHSPTPLGVHKPLKKVPSHPFFLVFTVVVREGSLGLSLHVRHAPQILQ